MLGRKKEYDETTVKAYRFTEEEKDLWANLFEYKGSEENVRLRFSLDKLGATLDDVVISYGEDPNLEGVIAWDRFIASLKTSMEDLSGALDEEPIPAEGGTQVPGTRKSIWPRLSLRQKTLLILTVSMIVSLSVVAIWYFHFSPPRTLEGEHPGRPSIAVLPFLNLTGDPNQDYFSDGLTSNIITQLYKMPNVFVIAAQSSFRYKGKAVRVQQVGRELGVRYVLEGSVERSGNRIRINAQLIDAETGDHLWTERYDRELKDVFALQDEIIREVVSKMAEKVSWGETARLMTHSTENYEALDYYPRAYKLWQRDEKESNPRARELLEKATELDPKYAHAIAFPGYVHRTDAGHGWTKDPSQSMKQAEELATRALAIDENEFLAHQLLGAIYQDKGLFEQAIAAKERALKCEPNNAVPINSLASALIFAGRPEEALGLIRKAMRLCPYPPPYILRNAIMASYLTGRYEAAITQSQNKLERFHIPARLDLDWLWLIASYMALGQEGEARAEVTRLLEQHPDFSIRTYIERMKTERLFKDYPFLDRQIKLLRKAGLK